MDKTNIEILNNFDIGSLPDLDTVVFGALELLADADLPKIDLSSMKHPLVTGSGNAIATGQIIFGDSDTLFATESDFEEKLKSIQGIDEVVVMSASGGKHAPIIAKKARQYNKHVTLITNTKDSPAAQALIGDLTEYVFPKNREPYTYNTSTYMSWLVGYTGEDTVKIRRFIEQVLCSMELPDFANFSKFYLITPPRFGGINRLLQVKFIELFGRNLARDIETSENVRHATTVAPSDELFISFGDTNKNWGKPENRLDIPLPDNAGYVAMMAVGYWLVAQIQKAQPQYFKDNIDDYCRFISGIFNEDIKPIVEA